MSALNVSTFMMKDMVTSQCGWIYHMLVHCNSRLSVMHYWQSDGYWQWLEEEWSSSSCVGSFGLSQLWVNLVSILCIQEIYEYCLACGNLTEVQQSLMRVGLPYMIWFNWKPSMLISLCFLLFCRRDKAVTPFLSSCLIHIYLEICIKRKKIL